MCGLSREEIDGLRHTTGRIVAPRQRHLGFLRALSELQIWLMQKPGWIVRPHPGDVARLFDKRWTSRHYQRQGIAVPSPIDGIETAEALRDSLPDGPGWYVKLASGSSAAGIALAARVEGELRIVTTVRSDGERLYNTRRLQTLRGQAAMPVLSFLLREGAQIEVAIDKARDGGDPFDLRVVVIDGDPAFVIPRCSQGGGPFTNLHLGGRRLELQRLRQIVPAGALERALDLAVQVAAQHAVLHLGVDIVLEADSFDPYVVEANAFGDWFPGLPIHEVQVAAIEQHSPRGPRRVGATP